MDFERKTTKKMLTGNIKKLESAFNCPDSANPVRERTITRIHAKSSTKIATDILHKLGAPPPLQPLPPEHKQKEKESTGRTGSREDLAAEIIRDGILLKQKKAAIETAIKRLNIAIAHARDMLISESRTMSLSELQRINSCSANLEIDGERALSIKISDFIDPKLTAPFPAASSPDSVSASVPASVSASVPVSASKEQARQALDKSGSVKISAVDKEKEETVTMMTARGGGRLLLALLTPDKDEEKWGELFATICLKLIRKFADLEMRDADGKSALLLVCKSAYRCVQRPLPHYGVSKRLPEIFLDNGCALTDCDSTGETPLIALARHVLEDERVLGLHRIGTNDSHAVNKAVIGEEYNHMRARQIMLINWISYVGDILHVGNEYSTVFSLMVRAGSIRRNPAISRIAILEALSVADARLGRFRTALSGFLELGLEDLEIPHKCRCGCIKKICSLVAEYTPFSLPWDVELSRSVSTSRAPLLQPDGSLSPVLQQFVGGAIERFRRAINEPSLMSTYEPFACLFTFVSISAFEDPRPSTVPVDEMSFLCNQTVVEIMPAGNRDAGNASVQTVATGLVPQALRAALIEGQVPQLLLQYLNQSAAHPIIRGDDLELYRKNWPALMILGNLSFDEMHRPALIRQGASVAVMNLLNDFMERVITTMEGKRQPPIVLRWLASAIGFLGNTASCSDPISIRNACISLVANVACFVLADPPPPSFASEPKTKKSGKKKSSDTSEVESQKEAEMRLAELCAIAFCSLIRSGLDDGAPRSRTREVQVPSYLTDERVVLALERCMQWGAVLTSINALHDLAVTMRACLQSRHESELVSATGKLLVDSLQSVLYAASECHPVHAPPFSKDLTTARRVLCWSASLIANLAEWMPIYVAEAGGATHFLQCLLSTDIRLDVDEWATGIALVAIGHIFKSSHARALLFAESVQASSSLPPPQKQKGGKGNASNRLMEQILWCLSRCTPSSGSIPRFDYGLLIERQRGIRHSAAWAVTMLLRHGTPDELVMMFASNADAALRRIIFHILPASSSSSSAPTDQPILSAMDGAVKTLIIGIFAATTRMSALLSPIPSPSPSRSTSPSSLPPERSQQLLSLVSILDALCRDCNAAAAK